MAKSAWSCAAMRLSSCADNSKASRNSGGPPGQCKWKTASQHGAHYVHMRWAVIVGVDGYAIGAESEDGGHTEL